MAGSGRISTLAAAALCLNLAPPCCAEEGIGGMIEPAVEESEAAADSARVLGFFYAHGILKGSDDPLRAYLFRPDGTLTQIGEGLARYLRRHPRSIPDFVPDLDRLRSVGGDAGASESAIYAAMENFERRFGGVSRAGAEDAWALGVQLETVASAAASAVLDSRPVVQIPTESGLDVLDDRGLAVRGQANGGVAYDRGVAELQRRMNNLTHRPACAPMVPETGRVNREMLAYSRCRIRVEVKRLEAEMRSDRVRRMAELLGRQPEGGYSEHDLETCRTVGGYLAGDLADAGLARRRGYLDAARRALNSFDSRAAKFDESETSLRSVKESEDLAVKYATLSRLEAQRYDLLRQRDRQVEGSESGALRQAIRRSPLNRPEGLAYLEHGRELSRRIDRLLPIIRLLETERAGLGGGGPSEVERSAIGRFQAELDRFHEDSAVYQSLPVLARAAAETSSDPLWNATARATFAGAHFLRALSSRWNGDWGNGYLNQSVRMERFRYDEAFLSAMRAFATTGDFVDVSKELARAGLMERGELERARRTLQAVTDVQAKAGVAVHLVGWSFGSAVLGPALSAGLSASGAWLLRWGRGLLAAGEAGAAARSAGFTLRTAGLILDNTARRLVELDAPLGSLRAQGAALRTLEGASVRFVNSSVRLGSFAGTSGVFSGLTTMIRRQGLSRSSAFLRGAAAGAQWSLDRWHPMLLVSGLPSSAAEGTPLAAASEAAATRGAVGLLSEASQSLLRRSGRADAAGAVARWSLERLSQTGAPGGWVHSAARWSAQIAGAADNAAKYMLLPAAVRGIVQETSFRASALGSPSFPGQTRTEILDQRVRRAVIAGLEAMNAPVWLLVPVTPSAGEAESVEARRGAQGLRERIARGEAAKIIEAGEGIGLRLYEPLKTFGLERLLHFQAYRDRGFRAGYGASFRVTPGILREAVRSELPRAAMEWGASREKAPMDPESVSPMRYLEISRMQGEGRVGRLWVNDLVRDEAYGLFSGILARNPKLAERVLSEENLGREVEGFGRATARVQEETAAAVRRAASESAFPPELLRRAERILEPYLATEAAVMAAAKDSAGPSYFRAIKARFSYFNRLGPAGDRLDRILSAMEREYEEREPVRRTLGAFRRMLRRTVGHAAVLGESFGLELPADLVFKDLASKWRRLASKFPEADAFVLSTAAAEAEAAPWLLRDAKGRPIKGWRPEQAELLSEFVRRMPESKKPGAVRAFLLMRTGGGKTLMAVEGLAPLLEADGRKTLFLTVRSNLESQARLEFRSLRKMLSTLEFGTWEGFKARLALGRIRGASPKGGNILGDEADGAASEPMLSVGDRTVEISRASPIYETYRRMREAVWFYARSVSLHPGKTKALEILNRRLDALTRAYARELLAAAYHDPGLSTAERWKLLGLIAPSAVWPRGWSARGSSWVREELLNLARGAAEDPNAVRMDHATGRLHRVHLGQWFENMDAPTRRYWELEHGASLTLPYEHRTRVTLNDILRDPSMNLAAFSGTLSPRLRGILENNGVEVIGADSPEERADLDLRSGPSEKYAAVTAALRDLSEDSSALVVTVVPGTKELRIVERVLKRAGLSAQERAAVFSDAEFLRERRPAARVSERMNLSALESGRARHLSLDVRAAGRGLDLDFRAYRRIVMLILDPQKMSAEALRQSQGRIAEGRLPKGAEREFRLILDIPTALRDPRFSELLAAELGAPKASSDPLRSYRDAVARALKARQAEIGDEELRESGMLQVP